MFLSDFEFAMHFAIIQFKPLCTEQTTQIHVYSHLHLCWLVVWHPLLDKSLVLFSEILAAPFWFWGISRIRLPEVKYTHHLTIGIRNVWSSGLWFKAQGPSMIYINTYYGSHSSSFWVFWAILQTRNFLGEKHGKCKREGHGWLWLKADLSVLTFL